MKVIPDGATGVVRLIRPGSESEILDEFGWSGDWPPPERLLVVVGNATGMVKVGPEELLEDADRIAEIRGVASVHWYMRRNASSLPESAAQLMEHHVIKGAEYVQGEEA